MQAWLLVSEAAIVSVPALLSLLMVAGARPADAWVAPAAFCIVAVTSLLIAWWRLAEVRRFKRWLARLAEGARGGASPVRAGPLAELVLPTSEMARSLADRDRRLGAESRTLATIVGALPDPVLVVDRQHQIRLANPAAEATFQAQLHDVPLGRAIRDPGTLAAVRAALATGTSSNVTFSPALDRVKRFAARVCPIELAEDETGVLLALREQTEQVLIERMRSDFVANASHEIRTPLATIIGIIETLRGPARNDAEARIQFLATLDAEAKRLQRLVDDLLMLSRAELAAHRPLEDRVSVGEVVEDVVARMSSLARLAATELEVEIERDLPPVLADADQLQQLVGNLVDNAIKYGRPGLPVRIEARRLAQAPTAAGALSGRPCVCVCVIDRGEGIAAEHLPRITERFYRIDKARSRKVGGTGLGLAIVKHIVRRHHGHLLVESEPGAGSRFCALLPLAELPSPPTAVTEL